MNKLNYLKILLLLMIIPKYKNEVYAQYDNWRFGVGITMYKKQDLDSIHAKLDKFHENKDALHQEVDKIIGEIERLHARFELDESFYYNFFEDFLATTEEIEKYKDIIKPLHLLRETILSNEPIHESHYLDFDRYYLYSKNKMIKDEWYICSPFYFSIRFLYPFADWSKSFSKIFKGHFNDNFILNEVSAYYVIPQEEIEDMQKCLNSHRNEFTNEPNVLKQIDFFLAIIERVKNENMVLVAEYHP